MNTKIVEVKGFKIHTRVDKSHQDRGAINEVIGGDGYGMAALSTVVKSPGVILDVGGHIGTFGLLAKKYWPEALLIAIEPNLISYLLYCKNMQENNCKNYYILNRAVSYGSKTVSLLESKITTGGGHITRTEESTKASIAKGYRITYPIVLAITVEEIVDVFNIKKIGLSKWDCEGGEIGAFENMLSETASIFEYIIGEYHIADSQGRHLAGDHKDCLNFFKKAGQTFPHLRFKFPEKGGSLGKFKAYL